jgi:uncharacterized membrane protein YeaQ/YmgE (transglycosylase-associated protein family)
MGPFPRLLLAILASAFIGVVIGLWMGDGPPPGIMLPTILAVVGGCVAFLTWTLLKATDER